MKDYSPIQKVLTDGIHKAFKEVFTDSLKIYLLDEDNTETPNVYGEADSKYYLEPKYLVGSITITHEFKEVHGRESILLAKIKVPTKSFDDQNIDISINYLSKSILEYKGDFFSISSVVPSPVVFDTHLAYTFECEECTAPSIYVEPVVEPDVEEPEGEV